MPDTPEEAADVAKEKTEDVGNPNENPETEGGTSPPCPPPPADCDPD